MKKLDLIILSILFAHTTVAIFATSTLAETEEQKANRVWCEWYGDMAEKIMTARQQGHPRGELVREVQTIEKSSQIVLIGLIDEAWRVPVVEADSRAVKVAKTLLFKQELKEWCMDYYDLN